MLPNVQWPELQALRTSIIQTVGLACMVICDMSHDYTDSALVFINVEQWLFSFFWRAVDPD